MAKPPRILAPGGSGGRLWPSGPDFRYALANDMGIRNGAWAPELHTTVTGAGLFELLTFPRASL